MIRTIIYYEHLEQKWNHEEKRSLFPTEVWCEWDWPRLWKQARIQYYAPKILSDLKLFPMSLIIFRYQVKKQEILHAYTIDHNILGFWQYMLVAIHLRTVQKLTCLPSNNTYVSVNTPTFKMWGISKWKKENNFDSRWKSVLIVTKCTRTEWQ